jgi:hypothetical protein
MKLIYQILFIQLLSISCLFAQTRNLIINEINESNQTVELYNPSTSTIDISNWWLCNRANSVDRYDRIGSGDVTLISGSLMMTAGTYTVLEWSDIGVGVAAELGLYKTSSFGSANDLEDYVMYNGIASPSRASVAVNAGVWASTSDFVSAVSTSTNSISLMSGAYTSGLDTGLPNWEEQTPTPGAINDGVIIVRNLLVNEINESLQTIEIFNPSSVTVDITNYWLCNRANPSDRYDRIGSGDVTLISGSLLVAPGAYTVLEWSDVGVGVPAELGLYKTSSFGNADDLEDYVMYNGIASPSRVSVAVNAGVWASTSDFVPAVSNSTNSIALIPSTYSNGTDTDLNDWSEQTPTQGMINQSANGVCDLPVLTINNTISSATYDDAEIIVSDGIVPNPNIVTFRAAQEISLLENFEVELGSMFTAEIVACN